MLYYVTVMEETKVFLDDKLTLSIRMLYTNSTVWWRKDNDLGLFFMDLARPPSSSEK